MALNHSKDLIARVVISSLPLPATVRSVYLGTDGVIEGDVFASSNDPSKPPCVLIRPLDCTVTLVTPTVEEDV